MTVKLTRRGAAGAVGGTPPTARIRRMAAGITLIVAPWGPLIANTGYAWATRHGGSDDTGAGALALAAAYPVLFAVSLTAGMIGCLLLIPASLAAMRLTRERAPWLGLVGGTLMIAGYACYLAILLTDFGVLAVARVGGATEPLARIIDAWQNDATSTWVFVLFVVGNILGTALIAIALWRSRTVPSWAAFAVLAWPVLHIVGISAGTEWFEVAGAALQAAGLAAAGVAVLRHSDRSWNALGGGPAVTAPSASVQAVDAELTRPSS